MSVAALGGGLHIPSVALAMALIIRLLVPEEIPRPVVEWNDDVLRERTHGTVLWPGAVRERVGVKAATDVLIDMRTDYHRYANPFHGLGSKDCSSTLPWTSCKSAVNQGRDGYVLEPDWAAQHHCPAFWAASGRQNAPGGTPRDMAHMIQTGLGDMRQALQLPSSVEEVRPADLDVLFAAWTTAKLGSSIHACWQLRAFSCSLERWSLRSAPLCETCLLTYVNELRSGILRSSRRWFPSFDGLVEGWPCVSQKAFAPLDALSLRRQQFSERCSCAFCQYLSIPPLRDAELVTKLVRQVEMKGHQSEPMDKAGVDRLFGTGGWRPMLFALRQDSKIRLVAVGRRIGHNGHINEHESLLLLNADLVAFAVRTVILAIRDKGRPFRRGDPRQQSGHA